MRIRTRVPSGWHCTISVMEGERPLGANLAAGSLRCEWPKRGGKRKLLGAVTCFRFAPKPVIPETATEPAGVDPEETFRLVPVADRANPRPLTTPPC